MKALFIMTSISFVINLLDENNIGYREWSNEQGEYEIRVDLADLEQFEIDMLKQEFNIKEPIDEYSYLIFWK